ncbi:hypothetical protein AAG570_009658 [Ranatra chinensis]|uniref:Protein sleepless n=1 Tax=Ranatra chinensis TaxID=642074 RepID=A0ABD0ZAU0_9HEMI
MMVNVSESVKFLLWLVAAAESLKCYQCMSTSANESNHCSDEMFLKRALKRSFVVPCPTLRSAFCVKMTVRHGSTEETTRGCSAPADERGESFAEGCMTMSTGARYCLCSEELCNAVCGRPHPDIWWPLLSSVVATLFGRIRVWNPG